MDFKLFYISNCPTLSCRHRKKGEGGGTHRNSTPNIHSERNYWVCSQNTVITLLLEHVALSETKCVLSLYSKQGRRCWKHVGFSVVVWSERSALCGAPWCVGLVQTKQTFKWITCCWVKGKKKWRFCPRPFACNSLLFAARHTKQPTGVRPPPSATEVMKVMSHVRREQFNSGFFQFIRLAGNENVNCFSFEVAAGRLTAASLIRRLTEDGCWRWLWGSGGSHSRDRR